MNVLLAMLPTTSRKIVLTPPFRGGVNVVYTPSQGDVKKKIQREHIPTPPCDILHPP